MLKKVIVLVAFAGAVAVAAPQAQSKAPRVTTPKEFFGHDIGDDYYLANYTQYAEYLRKIEKESGRLTVAEIGKTEEGRPELTAIITSPENHKRLAQLKEMNRKLALADGAPFDYDAYEAAKPLLVAADHHRPVGQLELPPVIRPGDPRIARGIDRQPGQVDGC